MKALAPCKINLTLEVGPTRADGYHSLRSIVLPLKFGDELTFTPADAFSTDTGYGEKDLIFKAARAFAAATGLARLPAYTVSVAKRIPVGGGLGGGSADAAATLHALNALLHTELPLQSLMEIGALVGSDVPALVFGRPCLMEGRGERITPLAKAAPREPLVLANPGLNSSTAAVYAACACRAALTSTAESAPFNDLEAPAVRLYPPIGALLAAMGEGAHMSGSGATCFRFCPSAAAAEQLAADLRARGYWSVVTATL